MIKLLVSFIICQLSLNMVVVAQINADIMRRVHSNIQGYELSEFFKDSEGYRADIIVRKIEELDLLCQLSYEQMAINIVYPSNGFKLYGFKKKGVICGDRMKTRTVYDGRDYNIFVIAVDTTSNRLVKPIKYVSGLMFLDNISYDFQLDYKYPKSYIDYIKLKLFYLKVEQLKFLNKKNGILYYHGYSDFEKKKFKLFVDTNSRKNQIEIETWL